MKSDFEERRNNRQQRFEELAEKLITKANEPIIGQMNWLQVFQWDSRF